jgi:tetratricopeptide (TPR) repeat protein
MKHLSLVTLVLVGSIAGCSRNNIEAVNLSNDGDKEKGTNLDGAISKWEQATNMDPENTRILWRLCDGYAKKEAWAKAIDICSKGAKKAPSNGRFPLKQGMALNAVAATAKGAAANWSESRGPLEEAIKRDPNLADAYYELAVVMLHTDDESGALRNYSKAIEVKPNDGQFYGPLIDLYLRLGLVDNAEQVAREGLRLSNDKHVFQLHSFMGDIQERKGNLSGAISSYETAKKACGNCNESGQAIAFLNLGAAYAAAKRNSEALQQLEKFNKVVCTGASAAKNADLCAQAGQLKTQVSGAGQ